MKLNKKIAIISVFLVIFLISLISYLQFIGDNDLKVTFLDIGQGDSILIQTPYKQNILIDGGPNKKVISELGKNLSWWDKKFDLIILTHAHDDHFMGLNYVLDIYDVENILYEEDYKTESKSYNYFTDLIDKQNVNLLPFSVSKIDLGDNCELNFFYSSDILDDKNLNNRSIVTKLDCNDSEFLFTGDIEEEIEEYLVADTSNIEFLKSDVLKVAHHGSNTSSMQEFLDIVLPEIAVIQVGTDNKFNHPGKNTLKRLNERGIEILRNDMNGTIYFIKNKDKKLIYNYEKKK